MFVLLRDSRGKRPRRGGTRSSRNKGEKCNTPQERQVDFKKMFIKFDDFNSFLKRASKGNFVSPGYFSNALSVPRQTVHYWINSDMMDALKYEGIEGKFILIDIEYVKKLEELRGKKESL